MNEELKTKNELDHATPERVNFPNFYNFLTTNY